ncbi:rna polymerase-associated protein ctr9 [Neofusicoccum parvum]|uniref:Rna polymerase-associated protein ctr9 n=1 Tax=Neofusicoccum parvum TaxID=310453 RepID=A0ACB5S1H6_9PEZI|nr:rna polymerase-associated protein ctr9 [Neofusicoccum parvum]
MPPNTWSPEMESRLFLAIVEVCDLKITGEQWKKISEVMGGVGGTATLSKAAATPKSAGRKKKAKENDDDADKTPRAATRKRSGKDYIDPASDEEDPESPTKKMKQEVVETSFFDQYEEDI